MGEQITVALRRTKDTPKTTRYDVDAGDADTAAVKTVYVRQSALEELGKPASIVVTVVAGDAA